MKGFRKKIFYAEDTGGGNGGAFDPSTKLHGDEEPKRVSAKYETQLSKEYQNDDFSGIESLDQLYKGYKDLKEKDKNALHLPTESSTIDEIKSFFTKIGMPETKEQYNLGDFDFNPDDIKVAKERFAEMAHKCGLTKSQANKLWKHELAEYADIKAGLTASIEKAKKEYEPAYDAMLKAEYPDDAKRAERRTKEDTIYKDFVAKSGLGDIFEKYGLNFNADAMHKIALYHEKYGNGTSFGNGNGSGGKPEMTLDEAMMSIYQKN